MRSTTVEPSSASTPQDWTVRPLSDGEIDRAGRARHERDHRGLGALADDGERAMPSLKHQVFDVGAARFADAEAVEPEEHRQGGVSAVVTLSGEEERAQLEAVETACSRAVDVGSAHVLRRVRRRATVDVGEPLEPAHGGEAPVDRRWSESVGHQAASVQLELSARRAQHFQVLVVRPLEEPAEVVAVRLERAPAVTGEERRGGEMRLVERCEVDKCR